MLSAAGAGARRARRPRATRGARRQAPGEATRAGAPRALSAPRAERARRPGTGGCRRRSRPARESRARRRSGPGRRTLPDRGSRSRAPGTMCAPRGIATPPISTGSSAKRCERCTGGSNRRISSTALARSAGSARRRAHSAGWRISASTPFAIAWTVVAKPAPKIRIAVAIACLRSASSAATTRSNRRATSCAAAAARGSWLRLPPNTGSIPRMASTKVARSSAGIPSTSAIAPEVSGRAKSASRSKLAPARSAFSRSPSALSATKPSSRASARGRKHRTERRAQLGVARRVLEQQPGVDHLDQPAQRLGQRRRRGASRRDPVPVAAEPRVAQRRQHVGVAEEEPLLGEDRVRGGRPVHRVRLPEARVVRVRIGHDLGAGEVEEHARQPSERRTKD